MSNKLSLAMLAEQAISKATQDLTFNVANCEVGEPSSSGNVGFRVQLSNGKTVTFWSSTMDQVVEAIDDDGTYRVIIGTRFAEDGGLIPATASQGGYWKNK